MLFTVYSNHGHHNSAIWSISLDLISGLPLTPKGHDVIITVVNRFTTLVTLIPCMTLVSGIDVAHLLMEMVFCTFGFPGAIVSDRDTRFTSGFYRELCHKLGIHQSMSTAWRHNLMVALNQSRNT
jgi:hypothetical protein